MDFYAQLRNKRIVVSAPRLQTFSSRGRARVRVVGVSVGVSACSWRLDCCSAGIAQGRQAGRQAGKQQPAEARRGSARQANGLWPITIINILAIQARASEGDALLHTSSE